MLIVCPSCATSYNVKPASLPPEGRRVRCVRCKAVWQAEPSKPDKLLAAAAAIAPDHDSAELAEAIPATETAASAHEPAPRRAQAAAALNDASGGVSLGAADDDRSFRFPEEAAEVEAPPTVPANPGEARAAIEIEADDGGGSQAPPAEDVETAAARWQQRSPNRRALRWPLSRLQSGVVALLLIDALVIGWRNAVVWALPQTASFYARVGLPVNLRGLAFDGVATTTEQHEGVPILVIEGNVVNTSRKILDVPRLKFVVRNAAKQEIYSWTAVPARTLLPPDEAMAFRTRLASPPPEANDLILRFVNRRDLSVATH